MKKVIKKLRKGAAPKTRNAGKSSEAEYFSKIRSALRNAFRYWTPMLIALEQASRPSQSTNKKLKKEYCCAHCNKWFKRTDVQIDHKVECGSLRCYEDIVPFIQRLTQENVDAYQILCKNNCHLTKTNLEKNKRKNGIK